MPTSVAGTASAPPGNPPIPPSVTEISEAIARGFSAVLKDMRAVNRETQSLVATITQSAGVTETRMNRAARVDTSISGLASPSGMTPREANVYASEARAVRSTAHTIHPATIMPNTVRSPIHSTAQHDPDAFGVAYGNSVQTIRAGVANRIASTAQNWQAKNGMMHDPRDPNTWYYADPDINWDDSIGRWRRSNGDLVGQKEMDAKRVITTPGFRQMTNGRWFNEATKKFATNAEVEAAQAPGWAKVAAYQSKARVTGAVSGVMSAWKEGQPIGRALTAALPASTAATLGVVAGGTIAAYKSLRSAAEWTQNEFARGRDISQYTGGSAMEGWRESWRDRAGAWMQGWNLFGPGSGDYEALAGGANRLGLRGGRKSAFLNTGLDLMGDVSMGSQETVRIMTSVIQAGQSLAGLDRSLKAVTKSARDAGIATDMARQKWEQNFVNMAGGIYGNTGQAGALATSQTNVQTAQGQGSSFSNVATDQSRRWVGAIAANQGMTVPEYLTATYKDPQRLELDRENMLKQRLAGIGFTQAVVDGFLAWFREQNGREYPSAPPIGDRQALGGYMTARGIDPYRVLQRLEGLGYTGIPSPDDPSGVPGGEVFNFVLDMFRGKGYGSQAVADAAATNQSLVARVPQDTKSYFGGAGTSSQGRDPTGKLWGQNDNKNLDPHLAIPYVKAYSDYLQASKDGKAFQVITPDMKSLPIVEKYLFDAANGEFGKSKVTVIGKDGKPIDVSPEEAISKYADQIQSGDAKFASGPNQGQSIASVYNVTGSGGTGTTTPTTKVQVEFTDEASWMLQQAGVTGDLSTPTVPTTGTGVP